MLLSSLCVLLYACIGQQCQQQKCLSCFSDLLLERHERDVTLIVGDQPTIIWPE